jgi:hypothetical protein
MMLEKTARVSGVFRRDNIYTFENFKGSQGDIVPVTDGCGHHIELSVSGCSP